MLEKAGMTTADLVKVTTSLTDAKDIPAYAKVRGEILGDVRPAFMLQVVIAARSALSACKDQAQSKFLRAGTEQHSSGPPGKTWDIYAGQTSEASCERA